MKEFFKGLSKGRNIKNKTDRLYILKLQCNKNTITKAISQQENWKFLYTHGSVCINDRYMYKN